MMLTLHDIGKAFFLTSLPTLIDGIVIAIAIFRDNPANPIFPRWLAWLNIVYAFGTQVNIFAPFFRTGPLALDGASACICQFSWSRSILRRRDMRCCAFPRTMGQRGQQGRRPHLSRALCRSDSSTSPRSPETHPRDRCARRLRHVPRLLLRIAAPDDPLSDAPREPPVRSSNRAAFPREHRRALIYQRRSQPIVEQPRLRLSAATHQRTHIVEARPAADDENAVVTQWRQVRTRAQVQFGVVASMDRKLDDRHLRLGKDRSHQAERAMIEPAPGVCGGSDAAILQHCDHARCQCRPPCHARHQPQWQRNPGAPAGSAWRIHPVSRATECR